MFFPLCSGFVEVLVVAAWGVAWTVVGAFLLSLLCVFFLQPCSPLFCFLLLLLTVLLSTGRAVAAGDDAGGGGEEADDSSRWLGRWQWLGSPMTAAVFFFFFPVQRRRPVAAFSSMVLQRGKKMVS
jgi:hypothetical protein